MTDEHEQGSQRPGAGSAIRAFQLGGAGLRRILGALQADLIQSLWQITPGAEDAPDGWATLGAVCRSLGPTYHYKTVQTVMNRMVEKGLLTRRKRGRAHEYRPLMTRDELVADVTREVVDGLIDNFGNVAIAQLVRTIQTISPAHRSLLLDVIEAERRAAHQGQDPAEAEHGSPDAARMDSKDVAR
jgi:predicted transcriptional regulator